MLNKMQGFADSKENKFCLFVKGIGFLDGEQAYIYLNEKLGD